MWNSWAQIYHTIDYALCNCIYIYLATLKTIERPNHISKPSEPQQRTSLDNQGQDLVSCLLWYIWNWFFFIHSTIVLCLFFNTAQFSWPWSQRIPRNSNTQSAYMLLYLHCFKVCTCQKKLQNLLIFNFTDMYKYIYKNEEYSAAQWIYHLGWRFLIYLLT